jgi:uncharacterized spore protein YtfJ
VDVEQMIERAREAVSGRHVYAEPYEQDGVTVIAAAAVRGGGGGGGGGSEDGEGAGGGFGLAARPVGAWVIKDGDVTWKPAVDVNRIVLGGQIVALAAVLVVGRLVAARLSRKRSSRVRRWPRSR